MTMPAQFPALQQRGLAKFIKLALDFSENDTLDPRITFSRTSNATRTNAQGLIEYAPHNLLTYSENFDNASWTKTRSSITANVITAPDGTTTADKFIDDGSIVGQGYISQNYTYTASSYVFSFYAKAGEVTSLRCYLVDSIGIVSASNAIVDLVSGTVTSGSAVVTDAGSGWYRIAVTGVPTAGAGSVRILQPTDTSTTNGFYIWGAQLNIGSLQPYYTTSVKNLLGYSQNFENAAWTKSNSSVLTNLLTYSQEFDNAAWTKGASVTIVANSIAAPDGTLTADKAIYTAAAIAPSQIISSSTITYTISAYVKSGNTSFCRLRVGAAVGGGGTSFSSYFNLSNGTVSSTGTATADFGVITPVITQAANGWYRISVTFTVLSATTSIIYGIVTAQTSGGSSAAGDEIYIWGAQLVQGTNPEQYTVTTSAPAPIQVMGPLGFLGAEKLVENTTNSSHFVENTTTLITGTIYTFSTFVKAAERNQVRVRAFAGAASYADFNLASGTVITTVGTTSTSIVSMGSGWYRCSITITSSTTGIGYLDLFLLSDGTVSYTGDGTSGIYIFGAQLSDSASLDPYSYNFGAAPTSSAYYGPRFDYDPVTLAPKGLLIEEARTNLFLQSEAFDNASWTKERSSISQNVAISPDGTQDADKFIEDTTASNTHQLYQSFAATSGTSYTASFYVKASERNWVAIRFYATNSVFTSSFAFFDVTNGVVGTVNAGITASITPVGNGWYRCTATRAAAATASGFIGLNLTTADNTTSYTGDGSSGAFVWGAQLEAGSFPTSYIPTTSAQVTRTADNASMVGTNFSSWYNQSEGTVATEYDIVSTTGTFAACSLNDNTNTNAIQTYYNAANAQYQVLAASSNQVQLLAESSTNIKTAFSYKLNDFAVSFNAGSALTDTSGIVPTVNQLRLGAIASGAAYLNGHIQSIKYFNKRLLNSYLQSLTQ